MFDNFKSKFKDKDKGNVKKAFITVTVFQGVFFAVWLLFLIINRFDMNIIVSSLAVSESITPQAAVMLIACLYLPLAPIWLICFMALNPFGFKKPVTVLFIIIGMAGAVGLSVGFFLRFLNVPNIFVLIMPLISLLSCIMLALGYLFLNGLPYKYYTLCGTLATAFAPIIIAFVFAAFIIYCIIKMLIILIPGLLSVSKVVMSSDPGVQTFISTLTKRAPDGSYVYTLKNGEKVYSRDGVNFYTVDGTYVGKSEDGKTLIYR